MTGKNRARIFIFLKHDVKASITVFFIALPLCLGISLASGAPIYTGLLAGIVGGIVIPIISKSALSVSGPAAGLTAICAVAITELGAIESFFLSVAIAGFLQILLGTFRLGGFTSFIPSAVIKGMLAAIGIILIVKQIPLLIGYDKPNFWKEQLFNLLTLRHGFEQIQGLYERISAGVVMITVFSLIFLVLWEKKVAARIAFLPVSFVTVMAGSVLAFLVPILIPAYALTPHQFVTIPEEIFSHIILPDFSGLFIHSKIWETGVIICFIASLETLLSIEAIDKIDRSGRITPQNRELVAQGIGNFMSGMIGGLPVTSVIVRSAANAEAGSKTKLSSFLHGIWLLVTILFATSVVRYIPYCVLAVLLARTGFTLAKPAMFLAIYKQGREQFLPFIVTVVAILLTDLLIGVLIGIVFAIYFLIKHTYRAGYTIRERLEGHTNHIYIDLALNVSFLNKKRFRELLEKIPAYSIVEINGTNSVYIDYDILEIFQDFKAKANTRHIQLITKGIREVEPTNLH